MSQSKKHSSLADQQERHDGMIQRRKPATLAEVPRVPMFPGADSLGCEGDGHLDTPEVPVFVKPGQPIGAELIGRRITLDPRLPGAVQGPEPSPTPAEPEKPAPGPATSARWALWSDGSLEIRTANVGVHLGPELARQLQQYLGKMGGAL